MQMSILLFVSHFPNLCYAICTHPVFSCTSSNHIVKLKKQMKKAVESSASGRPPLATSSSSQSIAAS